MEPQPPLIPTPSNTLHLDELIVLAAPTILAIIAVNQFAGGVTRWVSDAIVIAIVPPLTLKFLKPRLRSTKARRALGKIKEND